MKTAWKRSRQNGITLTQQASIGHMLYRFRTKNRFGIGSVAECQFGLRLERKWRCRYMHVMYEPNSRYDVNDILGVSNQLVEETGVCVTGAIRTEMRPCKLPLGPVPSVPCSHLFTAGRTRSTANKKPSCTFAVPPLSSRCIWPILISSAITGDHRNLRKLVKNETVSGHISTRKLPFWIIR